MNSPCPNKDVCGSCSWSHIPYDKQLQQKLSDINGSFAIKGVDLECTEILASPKTEHYRNRMDFVIDFEGRVGMRQKGKWWRVIDNHTCFLADEKIEELMHKVRDWSKEVGLTYFDRKSHEGFLRYAVIRRTTLCETMVTLVTSDPTGKDVFKRESLANATDLQMQATRICKSLAESLNVTTFVWAINHTVSDVSFGDELRVVHGPGYIEEQILDQQYRITPNAFFQTNPHSAPLLLQTVLDFIGDVQDKTVLDLYCGSGFFTIPLSKTAGRTIGVELVPEAIRDARVNAELNSAEVEFYNAKTEEFAWQALAPDVVLVDPPRSGMHDKALRDLIEAAPERIVYVSCSYKNLARELVELTKHYNVTNMRAIDMFPNTPHVEVVTVLDRIV